MYQQVVHKGIELVIKYIEIFKNTKDLEFSGGNSYSEDKLMPTLLDNLQKGRIYSDKICRHKEELMREENC